MTLLVSGSVRRLLALAIAVSIPLLTWTVAVQPAWDRYQSYQADKLDQVELLVKYNAHAAMLSQLRARRAELDERDTGDHGRIPADTDALASAHLQAAVTKSVVRNGGTVASMRVLPPSTDGAFRKVYVGADVRAPMSKFFDVLYEIEAAKPFIFVESLSIRNATASRPGRPAAHQAAMLSVRLQVSGFRKADAP